jgi:PAS domain S-box-containing protein
MNDFNLAELAQTLFEESGDALFLFDPASEELCEVNPMAQRLCGLARRELLGRPVTWLVRSEEAGGLQRLRLAFRRTGVFHSQEGFLLRHSQEGVWTPVNLTVTRLHTEPRTLGLVTARDVTERRRAQTRLEQKEADQRRLLASLSAYVWRAERDDGGRWRGCDCSPHVEVITGRPPEFFTQDPERWFEVIHPADLPRLDATFARAQAGRLARTEEEYRVVRPDGSVRWVRDSVAYTWGPGDGAVRLEGLVTDVTDRRRAEEAARSGEATYRALVESLHEVIYRFSFTDNPIAGSVEFVSPQIRETVGFAPEEFVRDPGLWASLLHPDDAAGVRDSTIRVLKHREPGDRVFRLRRRDTDEYVWLEDRMVPLLDDAGRAVGIQGACRDITERMRAAEALRQSEAKYRSLVENLEQAVFLKDGELRFLAANRPFCEAVGRTEAELVGRTDLDFYPPELAEKYRADDRQVLATRQPLELEEQTLIGGRERTVRVVKTPVSDGRGQAVGVLGIFWDVTEQRELEAQLRQAQKLEAVGQLAGGVAHDFNNLLTAILGNLSLIGSSLPADHPCREWAKAAEQAAVRAAGLTSQMLGFARRQLLRPQPTDLGRLLDEVVAMLRPTIDPRVTVAVRRAADGWAANADAGQVSQVLVNLCLNARDAMPAGGTLTLEAENVTLDAVAARRHLDARPGEFVRLRVSDTGHGIPADVLPRIYEPFFTTKPPGKGTGLGLAMVFGIVKQHRGWVDCHSEVGRGTTFDVYLPRCHAEAAAAPEAAPAAGGRETVLLVDDEAALRLLGQAVLERHGYRVLLAADGVEAVEAYRRERGAIGLVVLDLTMPRLSGREVFEQLVEIDPRVRVLFTSGFTSDQAALDRHEAVLGFVAKPYRAEELARRVRDALDRGRAPVKLNGTRRVDRETRRQPDKET